MIRQRFVSSSATTPAVFPSLAAGRRSVALTPALVWIAWAISRGIMLASLILGHHYCDPQFYQYAGDMAAGHWPYLRIPVEYPPFALLLIALPALPLLPFAAIAPRPELNPYPLAPDPVRYSAYGISFGLMMLALDALTLWLVMRVARRWTPGDRSGLWSGLLYVVLIFLSGTLLQKFDLVPGALCLLAVLLMLERQDAWAWAAIAVGAATKGYPVLLAPLFILWRMPNLRPDWVALRRAFVGGGVACLMTMGPVLLAAGIAPLAHSVLYHADRGTEIESTWASIILAFGGLPGFHAVTMFNPADLSRDIMSPLAGPLAWLATPALLVGCVVIYGLFWQRLRMHPNRMLRREIFEQTGNVAPAMYLMQATAGVILIFALCFRAMPAHYLLGVLPLAAVMRLPGPPQWHWLGLLGGGLLAGQFVVSFWSGLVALQPGPVVLMIVRNVLLVAACVALLRAPVSPRTRTVSTQPAKRPQPQEVLERN